MTDEKPKTKWYAVFTGPVFLGIKNFEEVKQEWRPFNKYIGPYVNFSCARNAASRHCKVIKAELSASMLAIRKTRKP
jgi:hypothetical protein